MHQGITSRLNKTLKTLEVHPDPKRTVKCAT